MSNRNGMLTVIGTPFQRPGERTHNVAVATTDNRVFTLIGVNLYTVNRRDDVPVMEEEREPACVCAHCQERGYCSGCTSGVCP